jgi:hypothetical protein
VVLVYPSPKTQLHEVGVLVDVSLNWTANGSTPEVAFEVKLDTGVVVAELTVMTL